MNRPTVGIFGNCSNATATQFRSDQPIGIKFLIIGFL